MHPIFLATVVFLVALAIAGGFLYAATAGVRPRRRQSTLPAWMDLDGSARRSAIRRYPVAHP